MRALNATKKKVRPQVGQALPGPTLSITALKRSLSPALKAPWTPIVYKCKRVRYQSARA